MPKEPTGSPNRTSNGHWARGVSGNPSGRPTGSRNKSTLLYEELLHSRGEELMNKAIELALKGDPPLLRLCLDRIFPAPKERRIDLALPRVTDSQQASAAVADVLVAIGKGEITPGEGAVISEIIEARERLMTAERSEQTRRQLEREAGVLQTELGVALGRLAETSDTAESSSAGHRHK